MATIKLNKFRRSALALLLASTAVGSVSAQDLGATPVTWVNATNVAVNGNTLTETCNGCGNAGAESQQALQSGDGYVEFVAGEGVFAIGVGSGAPGTRLESIENGLYFNGAGSVEVRENGGTYVIDTGYKPGDRFRIALQGGVISYHKYEGSNLTVNYTSKNRAAIQYPAKVEAVMLGAGSSVSQAVVRAGTVQANTSQLSQAAPNQPVRLSWAHLTNAEVQGNKLVGGSEGQNSGAISAETLTGDGFIEFSADTTDKLRAIGLDSQNGSNTFEDIEFAIVLRENGIAEVRENGKYISDTPYTANTRFRIGIENGIAKYYKYDNNGQLQPLQGAETRVTNFPLHTDAALYSAQAGITDITGMRLN